jgi:hypothetical protein
MQLEAAVAPRDHRVSINRDIPGALCCRAHVQQPCDCSITGGCQVYMQLEAAVAPPKLHTDTQGQAQR